MASRFVVFLVSIICLITMSYFAAESWLLDSGKAENVRLATRWMPWSPEVWRLMPQVDPEHAETYWKRVLKLAPRDVEARLALANDAELTGRVPEAERLLLDAATVDKGYLPAWSLANFYLRQDNEPQFWRWARRAATFEVDLTGLFDLALRMRPDPVWLQAEFRVTRPEAMRQLLTAAAHRELLEAALPVAAQVAGLKSAAAREQLLWNADSLLGTGHGAAALAYWNLGSPYPPMQPPTLFNGNFDRATLERGFDWRVGSAEVSVATGSGLHIGIYGKQDDTATLIAQTVMLEPGRDYELRYRYRTNLPAGASPVRWQVGSAVSEPLQPGDWQESTWRFTAPDEQNELKLMSRREGGTHKAAGEVEMAWVRFGIAD